MSCSKNLNDKIKENFRKAILMLFFVYTIIYMVEYIHSNKILHFLDYSYLSIFFLFFYLLNLLDIYSILIDILLFFLILGIIIFIKGFDLIEYKISFIKKY